MVGAISGQSVSYQFYMPVMGRNQRVSQAEAPKAGKNAALPVGEQPKQSADGAPVEPVIQNGTFGKIIPDPAEVAGRMRLQGSAAPEETEEASGQEGNRTEGTKDSQNVIGEEECQTCKNRKYQDGSDDPGVSFKTPAHIAPEQAASVVAGHEREHVVREQASAAQDGREVVSQSVVLHTGICPECGRVYVSGGTTRTVTAAKDEEDNAESVFKDAAASGQ